MTAHTDVVDRASGCLFGLALGDALAAETEFIHDVKEIARRFPPHGPPQPPGAPARVTDDTQMALAVGEALLEAERPYTAATTEGPLRRAFVDWADSPENDRSPGMTCLTACARLKMGLPWTQSTVANSKGCGANMRVAPVGLVPGLSPEARAALAQFQAALTHGHATALAASDLTAWTVADLAGGGNSDSIACLTGAFAGACRGMSGWPEDWVRRIEYRERLARLGAAWDQRA